jgi:hypothetical protein
MQVKQQRPQSTIEQSQDTACQIEQIKQYTLDMQQDIKDVLAKAAENRLLHKFDNYKESIQNPMGKQRGDVDHVSEY